MKTIMMTVSRGSLLRNFFHTGIVSKLVKRGIRVVILTPYYKNKDLFKPYKHENLVIDKHIHAKKIRARRVLEELMKGAVFNKTVLFLARSRILGSSPNKLLLIPRFLFIAPLRFLPGFRTFIRWLDAKINSQPEHDKIVAKYKPDFVFITSANGYTDSGLTKSAKRQGIKTVGMPKSWDNLSKILFNVTTDYLMVWSEFMKQQARRYQGYKNKKIFVTGVPQFDIYQKKEYLLSRKDFCQQFNFDPNKKIALYGSTGGGRDIGMEADYPEMMQKWIDSGKVLNVQILVRPHLGYKDDAEKFSHLAQYPNIVIDRTDKQDKTMRDNWDPSFNHITHLYNSLYHADVCINIASTLTLDAVACNTPVINIKFDKNPNAAFDNSARRLYETDYITDLMKMDSTWVVESREEFFKALQDILVAGKKKDTKKLIDYFLYKNDGQSAQRIADTLISLANRN